MDGCEHKSSALMEDLNLISHMILYLLRGALV